MISSGTADSRASASAKRLLSRRHAYRICAPSCFSSDCHLYRIAVADVLPFETRTDSQQAAVRQPREIAVESFDSVQ